MYRPDSNFVAPKPSRREMLLKKHGYYEGTIAGGVRTLTPTKEKWLELMDYISPDATPDQITTMYVYGRHEFDLHSEKDEKFSSWMERLGWLVRDEYGKLVEA